MAELRAFLAVAPPSEVRQALVDQIGGLPIPGRIVPSDNWHITLRFLGEVDEVVTDRFLAAADQSELGKSFPVGLDHLGAFPNHSRATVLWAGVGRGESRLLELAELSESAAEAAGLAREERPFHPHLTLSRIRPPVAVGPLLADAGLDVHWRVAELTLFQTLPGRGTVRYEPLETLSLSR